MTVSSTEPNMLNALNGSQTHAPNLTRSSISRERKKSMERATLERAPLERATMESSRERKRIKIMTYDGARPVGEISSGKKRDMGPSLKVD